MPVTMVVVSAGDVITTPTSSLPSTSPSTSTISTTSSSAGSTPTGPTQPATVSGGWKWYGCQTEGTNMRALNSATFAADSMTLEACATYCASYKYFGTEYARECYCGNSFSQGSVQAPATDCSFKCMGNALEYCGAGQRLSVYTQNAVSQSPSLSPSSSPTSSKPTSSSTSSSASTTSSSTLPYTDMTASGFAFVGCAPEERRATDGPGRTLTGPLYADDAMTDEKCMAFCYSNGYTFAGTEYTRECWCGNSVAPGRQPQKTTASLAGCNMRCGGDATQYCGGDAWLSLYTACAVGSPCTNANFS